MKKISFILLTIIFMLSLSVCAFGAGATSGTCGENAAWSYDTYNCTLTISGSGDLNDYFVDETPWDDYRKSIRTLIIEKGITSIGGSAFKQCYSLSNITIPETVKFIGGNAFYGCKALINVDIPEGVTTLNGNVFAYCENLVTVSLPKSLKILKGGDFSCCSRLQNVELPKKLETLGDDTFVNCYELTSIVIPDGITEIGAFCFKGCTKLQSITIPNSVARIGQSAFYECNSLKNIKFKGSKKQWNSITFEVYNENLQYGNVSYGGGFPILPIIIFVLIVAIAFVLIKLKKFNVSKAKCVVNEAKRAIEENNIITEKRVEAKRQPIIEEKTSSEAKIENLEKLNEIELQKDDWFKSAEDL